MFSQCESAHNYEYELTRNFAVTLQNSMTFGATAFPITGDIYKLFFMIQHRRLSYIQRRILVTQNIETKKSLVEKKDTRNNVRLDVMTTLWQAVYIVAHFTRCGESKVWKTRYMCTTPNVWSEKITSGISFLCFCVCGKSTNSELQKVLGKRTHHFCVLFNNSLSYSMANTDEKLNR